MKIWLLTHSEELKKNSGTGKLVKEILQNDCEVVTWSRVVPDKEVLALSPNNTLLIYLTESTQQPLDQISPGTTENIIILDGTWQQARKMYNQSPYLKKFKHYEIQNIKSVYSKRRNQKKIGLCTAEVVIHLLEQNQHPQSHNLLERFTKFNQ